MSSTQSITNNNNDLASKRRRFQPPITTFFNSTPSANSPSDTEPCPLHLSYNHYSATTFSPTPAVPAKVQSSLLSVGMRVRKSIADGYKTRIPKEEDLLLAPDATPQRRNSTTAQVGLAPFCGSTKGDSAAVRPLSTPPDSIHYNNRDITTDDRDAFSLPSSSQESASSTSGFSQPTAAQKRAFDADDADDFIDDVEGLGAPGASFLGPVVGRTILAPKLGQRRRFVTMHKQVAMDVDDFEEPAFLRRREEVDMDYEVQMGGV